MFQSQRRFFGGSNIAEVAMKRHQVQVSIAEAILWGEQLECQALLRPARLFQSQRRFFGGSNEDCLDYAGRGWRFNRRGDSLGGAT